MRINFDFLDLEAFLAVKELGSFHAAAARLNLSQSSVTRRVRKLELALGTSLFERTTREVRPTLAAKQLQLRAEAILQEAQETTRALRDETAAHAHQQAQTVILASVPTVIGGLVGPALGRFRAAGQSARVRILDMAANEVAEAVAQGEADLGICSIPAEEPMTEFRPLFSEELVLALRDDHPLAGRGRLTWADLADETLILPTRGTGNRLLIDEALARGAVPLRWTYEVGRTTTALELVSRGVGLAPVPRMALSASLFGGLAGLPLTRPEVSRPIGLLSRFGQRDRPAVLALRGALVAEAGARG